MGTSLKVSTLVLAAVLLAMQSAEAQERRGRIAVQARPAAVMIGGVQHVALEALLRSHGFDWSLRGQELVLREGAGNGPRIHVDELRIELGDRSLDVSGVRRPDGLYVPLRRVAAHLAERRQAPAPQVRVRGARETPQRAVAPPAQAIAMPAVPLMPLAPAAWTARHGLTAAQFQSAFDELRADGYRLVHMNAFSVAGQPRFAGIWEKRSGPAWLARMGMTAADYKSEFDEHTADGYRLIQVSGYAAGTEARYAAIWEKSSGPPRLVRHRLTSAQFQAELEQWRAEGYRLVLVDGYGVGNTAYFETIWDRSSGPAWIARRDMTAAQFQSEFDEHVADGYRLTHVSPYNVGTQARFAAIWEKRSGPSWLSLSGLTSSGFRAESADRSLQGYRLKAVAGYADGLAARYAAIWEAEPGALTGSFCQNGQCFDLNRFADNIASALAGQSVVKYGFEVRRGLTVIQRVHGPKRTAVDPPASNFTVFDRFNPASVSKMVTAVAVLQLLHRRGISDDSSIYPHLPPNWSVPGSSRTITFRQVMNHRSGLRDSTAGGYGYAHVKAAIEAGIDLDDKTYDYANINYALLRILVASLDGMTQWTGSQVGTVSSGRFIAYVNREIFGPLGIPALTYKPAGHAPTLFYRYPPALAKGTTYGDFSNMPGHAGADASVKELAVFGVALFTGGLLPSMMLDRMKQHRMGLFHQGQSPAGDRCWGHRGMFPAAKNQGAHLETALVHCEGGVTAMLVINGEVMAINVVTDAYDNAFVPEGVAAGSGRPGPHPSLEREVLP